MGCPCAGCNPTPKPTPSLRLPNGNYALGCLCENRELHILDSPGCTGNFAPEPMGEDAAMTDIHRLAAVLRQQINEATEETGEAIHASWYGYVRLADVIALIEAIERTTDSTAR